MLIVVEVVAVKAFKADQVKINFNRIKYAANPDRNKIPDILKIFKSIEG